MIARGRIVASGTPDELRAQTGHQNLEDAFVALAGLEHGAGEPSRAAMTLARWIRQMLVVFRKEVKDAFRDRRALYIAADRRAFGPILHRRS